MKKQIKRSFDCVSFEDVKKNDVFENSLSHENISTSMIRYLYHISDIHIRLYSRRNEYAYVFEKLYEYLRSQSEVVGHDHGLIVITGDVLHNKIDLQPECTMVTYEFLKELSGIFPTILIAGNHDALLNNRDRIDSLTSILYERTPPHLFYYTNTGIYRNQNIIFIVNSLLDDKDWISASDVVKTESTDVTVALYHGQIYGWKNNAGYQSEYGEKETKDFEGFDLILLGDIHKHQYMNNTKTMAYAGSLISQNYGETDEDHGVLVWNVQDKSSKLIRLENPYAYREFCLEWDSAKEDQMIFRNANDRWMLSDVPIPPWGNVKITYLSTLFEFQMKYFLKKRFPQTRFQFRSLVHESMVDSTHKDTERCLDTSEETFILDYISEKWNKENESFRKTLSEELLRDFYETRPTEERTRSFWELEYVRFKNLFGYGEVNEIDLKSLPRHTVTGIFGKNSAGKSTLIDIIVFLLYGKITRSNHGNSTPREVIHFKEKEGWGEIGIRLGSASYVLKKICQRTPADKIKIIETLFLIDENGERFQLTDEQRKKTDKVVHQMIGGCKSFLFTNLFLQQREESFRDMKQAARKDFLYDLFGLNWFEKYRKEKEDELKMLRGEEKVLRHRLEGSTQSGWEQKILFLQEEMDCVTKKIIDTQTQYSEWQQKRETLLLMLGGIHPHSLEEIQKNLSHHARNKDLLTEEIRQLKQRRLESERFLIEYPLSKIQKLQETSCAEEIPEKYNKDLVQKFGPSSTNLEKGFTLSSWKKVFEEIQQLLQSSSEISKKWHEEQESYQNERIQLFESKPAYDASCLLSDLSDWNTCTVKYDSCIERQQSLPQEKDSLVRRLDTYIDRSEAIPLLSILEKKAQERTMHRCRYDMEREQLSRDEHVKYNKDCSSCMTNPHYVRRRDHQQQCREWKKKYQTLDTECQEEWRRIQERFSFESPSGCSSWTHLVETVKQDINEKQEEYRRHADCLQKLYDEERHIKDYVERYEHSKNYRVVKKIEMRLSKLEKQWLLNPLRESYSLLLQYLENAETYRYIDERWVFVQKHMTERGQPLVDVHQLLHDYEQHKGIVDTFPCQIERKENELIDTQVHIEKWRQESQHFEKNQKIVNEMENLGKEMADIEKTRFSLETKRKELEQNNVHLRFQYEEWCKNETQYQEVSCRIQYMEKMITTIERDGLPLFLLKKKLPIIEADINGLLSSFLEKTLILRVEEKDVIVGIQVPTQKQSSETDVTNYLGGMESFLIDLSLKLGFSKFANLPRCNFFIIDEGISVMDQERIGNISHLFDFLSNITDHVFLISHLPTIKDFVHQSIEIVKDVSTDKSRLLLT